MSGNVLRDEQSLPELAKVANFHGWLTMVTDRLCEAWPAQERDSIRPAVRLAVDFHTWQLLVRRLDLAPEVAADTVRRLI
jgi:hypothetical protein